MYSRPFSVVLHSAASDTLPPPDGPGSPGASQLKFETMI